MIYESTSTSCFLLLGFPNEEYPIDIGVKMAAVDTWTHPQPQRGQGGIAARGPTGVASVPTHTPLRFTAENCKLGGSKFS